VELECDEQGDLIDRLELEKDRVRMLLDRYGIVFRELLADELPGFRWRDVFGALRLMELGGEVLVGQFFDGVPGVQFARPEAVARLEELAAGTGGRRGGAAGVFVVNAADPAAPCGWGLEGLGYEVPRKHPGTWLAFDGARLLLVARRNGAEVDITVPPADETLGEAMKLFDLLTGREFRPLARITVRAINGEDPTESPYRALFEAAGFRADFRALVRWAGYR
jgi:ATP-dependent Lhr-like helicase